MLSTGTSTAPSAGDQSATYIFGQVPGYGVTSVG
jgi:hypothetical protein